MKIKKLKFAGKVLTKKEQKGLTGGCGCNGGGGNANGDGRRCHEC